MKCSRCGADLPPPPYSRRDTCPSCRADLHACIQCSFFSPGAYNDCREPQADRVVDKDRANFCDCFQAADRQAAGKDPKEEARARLDALFKKKA